MRVLIVADRRKGCTKSTPPRALAEASVAADPPRVPTAVVAPAVAMLVSLYVALARSVARQIAHVRRAGASDGRLCLLEVQRLSLAAGEWQSAATLGGTAAARVRPPFSRPRRHLAGFRCVDIGRRVLAPPRQQSVGDVDRRCAQRDAAGGRRLPDRVLLVAEPVRRSGRLALAGGMRLVSHHDRPRAVGHFRHGRGVDLRALDLVFVAHAPARLAGKAGMQRDGDRSVVPLEVLRSVDPSDRAVRSCWSITRRTSVWF